MLYFSHNFFIVLNHYNSVDLALPDLMPSGNKHVVTELAVSKMDICWDSSSLSSLCALYQLLLPRDLTLFRRSDGFIHDRLKAARMSSYYHRRKGEDRKLIDVSRLLQNTQKWSVEAAIQGIKITIPYSKDGDVRNDSNSTQFNNKKRKRNFLCLKIGRCGLQGGDFLLEFLNHKSRFSPTVSNSRQKSIFPEEGIHENDDILFQMKSPNSGHLNFKTDNNDNVDSETDDRIRDIVGKNRSSIVNPFVFHVSGLNVSLTTSDSDKAAEDETIADLTRIPWHFAGSNLILNLIDF